MQKGRMIFCKVFLKERKLACRASHIVRSSRGFTSIELVIVILALAILTGTVVASYRLSDTDKSNIAADQLIADIQYVQMRAMGIGSSQSIRFVYGSSSYSILDNLGGVIEQKTLPDNVRVISTNFGNTLVFNTIGEPTFGSSLTGSVNLGRGATILRAIAILPITGKAQ